MSASSAFPIRSGNIEGVPIETGPAPPHGDTRGPAAPTPTPAPPTPPRRRASAAPGATRPNADAHPRAVADPGDVHRGQPPEPPDKQVRAAWSAAGFSGAVVYVPLVPPNYRISGRA